MAKVSPFAPKEPPRLPAIDGVRFATCAAGIRYPGRTDLLLVLFEPGTTAAGVLTRSKTASAPVEWCRARLQHGMARVLVVNSGNSNAFTGKRGREAVKLTAEAAAEAAGCLEADVYLASTGVIGEPLDPGKFTGLLAGLAENADPEGIGDAARAIMTTDTYAKLATRQTEIEGVPVTINGIAKGAGMIAPDMATMLAFIFTDAAIEPGRCVRYSLLPPTPPSTPSPSTATPRRATRFCCSPPARQPRAARRASGSRTTRGLRVPRGPHRGAARSRAPSGERRGRGDEVRHGRVTAPRRPKPRAGSRFPSPTRRW